MDQTPGADAPDPAADGSGDAAGPASESEEQVQTLLRDRKRLEDIAAISAEQAQTHKRNLDQVTEQLGDLQVLHAAVFSSHGQLERSNRRCVACSHVKGRRSSVSPHGVPGCCVLEAGKQVVCWG